MICKRAQKYKNNIKHNELGKALHKRINSASYILEGGGGGANVCIGKKCKKCREKNI